MNGLPWGMWLSQVAAVLRIEARKNLGWKRAAPVYLLALAPVFLFGAHSFIVQQGWDSCNGREDLFIYAGTFQVFVLRLGIFFGCVAIFMNLFRAEVLEKSLHYYFLAPVRREVLVAAKYISGLATAVLVFSLSTLFSFLIALAHISVVQRREMFAGPAVEHLFAYLGVTALACMGYGAAFTAMGLLYRNPIVPAVAALSWESLTVFLPPVLKQFSIIFYLESLCPVRVPIGNGSQILAMSAEPMPAYVAVPGLLVLTGLVLAFAAYKVRRMEISYGTE